MTVKIHCHESLESLAPQHKAMFKNAELTSYDLGYSWFANLVDTALDPNHKIRIYVAEDDSGEAVILPLYYINSGFKPRKIGSLVNFYSSQFSPIVSSKASYEWLGQALIPIRDNIPRWDAIDFSPLSLEGHSFGALYKALRSIGMLPFKYFCFGNWYLPVCGRSYSDYYQSLPSRLKNTLKRKQNRFFSNGSAHLEIITGGADIESGMIDFQKVYNSSWKVSEPFPKFIPGLIRLCAEQRWLRLGIAYLQGEPIAAQIWIVAHGRAAIFKLAYDQKFASYSPGSILTSHLMKHVIDVDRVAEVDYLIGDDPYKKDWMSHRRERWGIIAYNPRTPAGLMGALKQRLGDLWRGILSPRQRS